MKTLIFNGSPRKNGDTKSLLNELVKHLDGENKVVDAFYCNITPCIDCRYCWDKVGCCQTDEWKEIDTYIKECDNIVIASPIYFSELTGQLLSIVSKIQSYWSARFYRSEEIIQKPKKGGIILVGGGDGYMSKPIETARTILHHMNSYNINEPICYHDTNKKPAKETIKIISELKSLAAFFNK